jgi:hypothetical protein
LPIGGKKSDGKGGITSFKNFAMCDAVFIVLRLTNTSFMAVSKIAAVLQPTAEKSLGVFDRISGNWSGRYCTHQFSERICSFQMGIIKVESDIKFIGVRG